MTRPFDIPLLVSGIHEDLWMPQGQAEARSDFALKRIALDYTHLHPSLPIKFITAISSESDHFLQRVLVHHQKKQLHFLAY